MTNKRLLAALAAISAVVFLVVACQPPPPPPPPPHPNTAFPIRAGFQYLWYKPSWNPGNHDCPTLGCPYDSQDPNNLAQEVAWDTYAGMNATISSWWGPGHYTDTSLTDLLNAAHGTTLKVTAYYECEGNPCASTAGSPDPSQATITDQLNYLWAHGAQDPSWLWVNDKPVLFVYNANDSTCAIADKWVAANAAATQPFYIVLKVFGGYASCPNQPDNWHQYGPAVPEDHQGTQSFTISPGFFRYDQATPQLARDPARWATNVHDMVCSNANFQLVTTLDEFNEDTAVNPTVAWGNTYLDTLHNTPACGG